MSLETNYHTMRLEQTDNFCTLPTLNIETVFCTLSDKSKTTSIQEEIKKIPFEALRFVCISRRNGFLNNRVYSNFEFIT